MGSKAPAPIVSFEQHDDREMDFFSNWALAVMSSDTGAAIKLDEKCVGHRPGNRPWERYPG